MSSKSKKVTVILNAKSGESIDVPRGQYDAGVKMGLAPVDIAKSYQRALSRRYADTMLLADKAREQLDVKLKVRSARISLRAADETREERAQARLADREADYAAQAALSPAVRAMLGITLPLERAGLEAQHATAKATAKVASDDGTPVILTDTDHAVRATTD